ncbi:MAG: carbohydrate binding domain-containing protein [Pirellulales bacterium]|nr:carbohydrate binding domain-containing protein [Pirellulales bacterium]
MRLLLALIYIAILSSTTEAAVTAGENLLINGSFDAEQVDFPEFWSPSSSKNVVYNRAGGPEGKKASIVLKGDKTTPTSVNVRQQGIVLVPGEKYKLSGYIKTKGYKSHAAGLVVHNGGWTSSVGFQNLPADSDWTFKQKTFTLFPSKTKDYGLAMYANDLSGEIHFADIKLVALGEKARKGSASQMTAAAAPKLVPLQPLLNKISHAKPEMNFGLYGVLPEKSEAYECLVTVDGNNASQKVVPLDKSGNVNVKLTGLARGDHVVKAVLRHRKTLKKILEVTHPVSIIDIPTIDRTNIKQLNNLVAEVLNRPIEKNSSPQSFTFVNPRDGWIFVKLDSNDPAPDLSVKIDDRDTVITARTDRLEAFRELSMGEHRITVSGNRAGARLIVRSIPEIFDYPPCSNSYVKENGSYGWEFMKKHVLPAVTTLNGGSLTGKALDDAKARGLKWLANFNVAPVVDPLDVRNRMEKHPGMTQPQYDGFTSDELFFGRGTIDNYTQALKQLRNPENRLVYTWIVGKPNIRSLHTDFISTVLNASRGRGRLLYEAYCRPQADEKAAAAYLDNMVSETMRRLNSYFPNAAVGTGIIFGNFNQMPYITLEYNPAVDFKYYLDMQVNLIANSPEFKNLATTGYWGTYYGDEELVRWSFKLMRHYAVEGRRDMLSKRYGFKYKPGFLSNCDFADGLDGWTSQPAAKGSIRTEKIPGYGRNSQARWGGGSAGNSVCVMIRGAGKANRISQTAHGLEVGKVYCLQFVTADFNDVTGKKYNPRRYGINVELDGAEILPGKGYVHIDRRKSYRRKKSGTVGKINLNRIIFRAKSPTQVVAFNDEKAATGEELMINFIQLKPYLE